MEPVTAKRAPTEPEDSTRSRKRSKNGSTDAPAPAKLSKPIDLIEEHAISSSSATFVLDTWPSYDTLTPRPNLFKLESRDGIGAAIQGYVAATSSSSGSAISVLATPASLLLLAPALAEISASSSSAQVVVHVAANSNNAAALFEALSFLSLSSNGWNGEINFSGGKGAKEILEVASSSYSAGKSAINVFDDVEAGQEYGLVSLASASGSVEAFTYDGPSDPHALVLLPSSLHSALAVAALKAMDSPAAQQIGVLTVRAYSRDTFANDVIAKIPASVQAVHAPVSNSEIDEPATWFYDLALTALAQPGSRAVLPLPLVAKWTVHEWGSTLVRLASPSSSKAHIAPKLSSVLPTSSKLATFWTSDVGGSSSVASSLADSFARFAHASKGGVVPRLLETFDNTAGGKHANGLGLKSSDLLLSPVDGTLDAPLSALALTSEPSFIFVSVPQFILKSYNAVERAGPNTQIVFSSPWAAEEYKDKLGQYELEKLADHQNVWTINSDAVAKEAGQSGDAAVAAIEQIAFWSMYLPQDQAKVIPSLLATSFSEEIVSKLVSATKSALHKVSLSKSDEMEVDEGVAPKHGAITQLAPGEGDATRISHPSFISIVDASSAPNAYKGVPEVLPESSKAWHLAAKQLLYPEAYAVATDVKEKMRPDLPEDNYIITVTENRRLTPLDYDRNVFHLEFSTKGTGLKYAVGEALGIHGLNDTGEVLDFLEWYGLDKDGLVSYPSRTDPAGKLEVRTIFQLFQQNLDIFGKPPKSFYETLSKFASEREEARHLRFISAAEGSSTFKKWAELDTVTYADVLKAFPSARANFKIEDLIREVASIKPRHYSIASSQNYVGDSVHLLVVTVDWDTPAGVKRYGQCTRYLAGLPVGAQVMASVKPSVMKLPPRDTQPIIMAGLGTGAAPFRAFMQERAWQRAQGIDVGPLLYYFGARYRSAEYLYGEEIEAYVADGVLSHTGLAFSRDTKAKVYIQHKMNEDGKMLADDLDDGVFYLCGPTWPVPDVYKALTDAFETHRGKNTKEAEAYIEELKEDERYVLEVY